MQLNSRKINDPVKKWAKELNRHFSKEHIWMAPVFFKRASEIRVLTTGLPGNPQYFLKGQIFQQIPQEKKILICQITT